MIPFKKIVQIPLWKKVVATGIVAGLSGMTALYIPILVDKELYKNLVLATIKESVDYKIEAGPSALFLFPLPELRISEITIHKDKESDSPPFARIGEMHIKFSWMSLIFRKVQITEIEIMNGNIQIIKNEKEEFNVSKPESESAQKSNFLKLVSVKSIALENIHIEYNNIPQKETRKLYVYRTYMKFPEYLQSFKFNFLGKLDNEKLELSGDIRFRDKNWNFSSLLGTIKIDVDNFDISYFKKYLHIFYNGNFYNSRLKGIIYLSKSEPETINIKVKDAVLWNFGLIGQNFLPQLRLTSDFDYTHKDKKFVFHSVTADQQGIIRGKGIGTLKLGVDGTLYSNINSDFLDFDGLMKLVKIFSFHLPDKNPDTTFTANYNLVATNIKIWGFQVNRCDMELKSINKTYFVKRMEAKFFNGEIVGQGEMAFDHIPTYDFELAYSSIDMDKLIAHYTKDKYVTGQLEGIIKLYLVGKTTRDLFRTLRATGNLTIYKGELLGYANIVKPIASIGKFINILGPKGKSTEFQFLHADYSINDEEIDFKKIKMKGVGIDIEGQGMIGFNKEINMRFTAGLSGIVGKALKVPVFYKGVMPKNWAYVDPIWLATVAGGAILSAPGSLFGSPVAGGIAGSAAYEYVRGFWDGVTGIFTKNKEERKK